MGTTTAPGPRRGRFVTAAALLGGAVSGRLRRYEIVENSMRPTLRPGDWILACVRPRSVRPGDVVVLTHPHRSGFDLVKRVSTIGDDGVLVLGDDPGAGSVDSVEFGPVPRSSITARVMLRYRPLPPMLTR